jgi:two-component system response regulator PilR (NtrC family)
MREMLGIALGKEGYAVVLAESRATAAAVLAKSPVDMVITDVKLPDGDGMEILRHVKAATADTPVVVMTAYGSTETAVTALKLGAQDYLVKPFDLEELKIVVRGALEKQRLHDENIRLKAELRTHYGLERMLGTAPTMVRLFETIRTVAQTSSTVLVSGESGTGKELVARAIHALSPRRDAAFVSINCGALPETLLESELFGHMKGSFTDAHQTKRGLFEMAHRGTLLLDEVGDMPLSMQVKLLRALQEKRVRRVGATEEIEVDVRVIGATNRTLDALVRERQFREDLFYRLNVIPLRVPPLRERREDIPLLVDFFLKRFSAEMGKHVTAVSHDAMARLVKYSWPGNVRELENVLERAVALETTPAVLIERLPETVLGQETDDGELPPGFSLDRHLQEIERKLLQSALQRSQGDRARAAALLGVSPRSFRYLIQKHRTAVPAPVSE